MSFTHLHLHTEHSFLDGVPTLADLADRVIELGQNSVAITDHGEVSGHLKFQSVAQERGIKPIFGLEGYFVDDRYEKEGRAYEYDHITLLAYSNEGLHNLWTLSSLAYIEGMYYKPRIDWELLQKYGKGIVGTGGCLNGCVAKYLKPDSYDPEKALERMSRFTEVFDGNFYLELHTFPNDLQREVNQVLVREANTYGIPYIAVSDAHYLYPEDWQKHEILIASQMKKAFDDPTRFTYGEGALAVIGEDEVRNRLLTHLDPDVVELAISNTTKISDMCDVTIEGNRTFPVFLSKPEQDVEHLRVTANEKFKEFIKKAKMTPAQVFEYQDRFNEEMNLIVEKGYAGYFLVVADLINWAKQQGILMGPGRGSAGGSLVSFILGITEIDPVPTKLIFARFLDPGRKSLPDIDIDVPQSERHRVRKYLEEKYHVATIGTLNTLAPRMLLRDLARVLKLNFEDTNKMIKIIENTKDLTVLDLSWQKVLEANPGEFGPWMSKYPQLFELMEQFASHYRHAGAHAAGLVVSREDLMGKLPLRQKDDDIRTQMPMEDVEELGYVKIDLLGLRTLSTLQRAYEMITKSNRSSLDHFYDWKFKWEAYYEDPDVFRSLWDGNNVGVFQIETSGLSELCRKYMPTTMEDMCALVSLFRPGITRAIDPETGLNLMELFLAKRHGKVKVTYKHPDLEPILENTYGMFLYQEQVMQAFGALAGYTPGEQDRIRKIMGKTKPEEMREQRAQFIERCIKNDMTIALAESIWNDMEQFGVYSFNRSHAYAYGMIAYWTAWMKHHYPAEFMLALFITNDEDTKPYVRECRRLGIDLRAPDVNATADFSIRGGGIQYGLTTVKFVSSAAKIIEENAPYDSVTDILTRLADTKVNKRALESLIRVGALDDIVTNEERSLVPRDWSPTKIALWLLFCNKNKLTKKLEKEFVASSDPTMAYFSHFETEFESYAEELRIDDRAYNEVELLADNVTTEPFSQWLEIIKKTARFPGTDALYDGESALLGGVIKRVNNLVTKRGKTPGQKMAQIWIEFPILEGDRVIDVQTEQIVAFPEIYAKMHATIQEELPVFAKVTKMKNNGGLMLQKLYRMEDL